MMTSWILISCLTTLFDEFDRIAPRRDKASDGSIGDTAHQQESSDHNPDETGSVPIHDADKVNEVHAIDVDNNLNAGDLTMEKVVQFLLGRCRSGAEKRLRYIIYNRRIWSASSGWVQKTYTGASAHTEHAHFSASYETAREADTSTWGLIDEFGGNMLVKEGAEGEQVSFWQYILVDLGYDVGQVDGVYGPKMAAAVAQYRAHYGLKPDDEISGWCGRTLLRDLMAKYAGHDGAPGRDGKDGAPGKDGKDGTLSGALTVTGGQLTVEQA